VLHHNRISSLCLVNQVSDADISFPHLATLDLSHNVFTSIVEDNNSVASLSQLYPNLRELRLSYNQIRDIPKTIPFANTLEALYLNNNKISSLPIISFFTKASPTEPDFGTRLPQLSTLDVSNNDITVMPPVMGLMELRMFAIEGNRFRVPNYSVVSQGTPVILKFLKQRVPGIGL
jgi:Leucine-rich repeat (LRR) protein